SKPESQIPQDQLNQFVDNVFSYCRRMQPKPLESVAIFKNNGWFSCPEQYQEPSSNVEETAKNFYRRYLISGVGSLDSNPVIGKDPLFKNPMLKNFEPSENSPLLGKATNLDFVKNDIRGIPRPQGVAPDIGAYELTQ
ncbi:MAG: choice-of-anchor Q domain-containing protein, partial [Desulfomonilaceae bacterium]